MDFRKIRLTWDSFKFFQNAIDGRQKSHNERTLQLHSISELLKYDLLKAFTSCKEATQNWVSREGGRCRLAKIMELLLSFYTYLETGYITLFKIMTHWNVFELKNKMSKTNVAKKFRLRHVMMWKQPLQNPQMLMFWLVFAWKDDCLMVLSLS